MTNGQESPVIAPQVLGDGAVRQLIRQGFASLYKHYLARHLAMEKIAMSYVLPNFNLRLYMFPAGSDPSVDPPIGYVLGQLYYGSRAVMTSFAADYVGPGWHPFAQFRVSKEIFFLVDPPYEQCFFQFNDENSFTWTYKLAWWDWVHASFPNAYVLFCAYQVNPDGTFAPTNR